MRTTEEALVNFFKQVALKNKTVLSKINTEQNFAVKDEKWKFTLPNLFSFLQIHDQAFSSVEYNTFRQVLFNSPINQTVKSLGAEICIFENNKNTDKSLYCLEWKI